MQYKLLIVDDDKALAKMLDNNFTIKNYDVRSAAIGEEASEFNKRKNFSLRDRNEEDFAATGIMEMSYNWLYMESWVALFAGCGQAVLCFSMYCGQSYP